MKKNFIGLVLVVFVFSQLMQGSDVFAQEDQPTRSKKIMYCVLGGGTAICVIYAAYHHLFLIKSLWHKKEEDNLQKKEDNLQKKEENLPDEEKNKSEAHDPRVVGLSDQISQFGQDLNQFGQDLNRNFEFDKIVIEDYKRAKERVNWAFGHLYTFMLHVGTKIQEECKDRYQQYVNAKKCE